METGREVEKDSLERIADALEKLASDPMVEIESGPPICPNCGKMNPVIVTPEQGELSGPMLELIIHASCKNCGGQLFICIESFSVHRSMETLRLEMEERKAGFS